MKMLCSFSLFVILLLQAMSCADSSTDPCDGINCQNGGACDSEIGSCDCPEYYSGEFCEQFDAIQKRLDNGETPLDIYKDDNTLLDSLYGKEYQGGLIFYLDTIDGSGLVMADTATRDVQWGCYEMRISGADGKDIGSGKQNTLDILAGCQEFTAAELCDNLVHGSYDDWFLPARNTYQLIYSRLYLGSHSVHALDILGNAFWSSTQVEMPSRDDAYFVWWTDSEVRYERSHKTYRYYALAVRAY